MFISVVTPTYNRGHTLPRLYKSLLENSKTYSNFEWLIMDDGSEDNTKNLIEGWVAENNINIKVYYQTNMGKMSALNNLIPMTAGDIIIECDSDDYLTNDALSIVTKHFESIKESDNVYGICFLKNELNGNVIGNTFKNEGQILRVFDMYFKEGIIGDKCIVFKGNIRRKYKHKLELNEKFVTEGRLLHEMDLNYKGLICLNISVMMCEYQEDGYTKNIHQMFRKNPSGYYFYYLEMFDFDMKNILFKQRLYILKHYILFSCFTGQSMIKSIAKAKGYYNKILVTVLVLPGYLASKMRFSPRKRG